MQRFLSQRALVALAALALPTGLVAGTLGTTAQAGAAPSPGNGSTTLRVGCGQGAYSSVEAAVTAASSGDTVVVCSGTYDESVVVPADKTLTIKGLGHPVIDAVNAGAVPGIQVLSSGTTIERLTVENATGEGILVGALPGNPGEMVSDVTIRANTVKNNDRGNPTGAPITDSPYAQCNAVGGVPGDCGEGIHLLSASGSLLSGNLVTGNSGGILLTDENGPTHQNVVSRNVVRNNVHDCGVTMASHAPKALGGVFDNQVVKNEITGNGTQGEGGGVLLATPVPGSPTATGGAVYDNLVASNHISGNGLAAVTVHSHLPHQDLNGNTIEHNLIGTNNLVPDHDYESYGYFDSKTTGVIVATLSDLSITIRHNVIAKNEIGVWLASIGGATIDTTGLHANVFAKVGTAVSTAPQP